MISLKRLKDMGAISNSLIELTLDGVSYETISSVQSMTDEEQKGLHSIVTVDAPKWVATSKGRPAQEAASVYSGNDAGEIGCWKSKQRDFLLMELSESRLQTINVFSIKEEENMKLENTNKMDAFEKELGDISADALKGNGTSVAPPATEGKVKELSPKALAVQQIRSSVEGTSLADNSDAVQNNRKNGRLLFFVTPTDDTIKVQRKTRVRLDANKKRVVDQSKISQLSPDKLASYQKTGNYPQSLCEKDTYFAFTNVKPGKPLGLVIATPACSDIPMTKMYNREPIEVSSDGSTDMNYNFVPIDYSYSYIAFNYNGKIKEDEKLVGPLASTIELRVSPTTKTNKDTGVEEHRNVESYRVYKEGAKRKQLLISTNYFPVKTFKTVPVAGADATTLNELNNHFAALLTKGGAYDAMCDESKAEVKYDGTTATSDWFNNGKPIQVLKFDAATTTDFVTDVKMPIRKKVKSKTDPNKWLYPFEHIKLGEEGGPQADPRYRRFIEAVGLSEEEFINNIKKFAKARTSNGSQATSLTADEYLRTIGEKSHVHSSLKTTSLLAIQEAIFGV